MEHSPGAYRQLRAPRRELRARTAASETVAVLHGYEIDVFRGVCAPRTIKGDGPFGALENPL